MVHGALGTFIKPGQKEGRTDSRRLPSIHFRAVASIDCLFQVKIDAFAQLLARLEVRDVLARQCHSLTSLGITPHARRSVMPREAAEATPPNAFTVTQSRPHLLTNPLHG